MSLIRLFLSLASPRSNTNTRDPEIGLEILPEDTFDEPPSDDRHDIGNDDEDLNGEVDGIGDDANVNPSKPRLFHRFSSGTALTWSFSRTSTQVDKPWFQKVKDFVFPAREHIDSFIPNYRHLPIISGLLIPFSILLGIPGLTERWYIRTENNEIVESRANPVILDAGLGISLACAVIANICLITRFLEKRARTMTILCIISLMCQDIINIIAVTTFGVQHRFSDGFTYGQSFWMTICSTVVSSITTATLIWDFYRTPDFNKSGSGLTRRQRTLVIIIMILFCYICFGALVNSLLQKLSFIDGLYFTVVSIETIGFGDITPKTTGARVFICIYSAVGFLNLGVAIVMCREAVLEAMEVEYKKRAQRIKERWKEARQRRHIEHRWRHAIEWRLKEMGMPLWVRDENWHGHRAGGGGRSVKPVNMRKQDGSAGYTDPKTGRTHSMHVPTGMRLNLNPLTLAQLEASAAQAGAPLDSLLPSGFRPAAEETAIHDADANQHSTASAWLHHPLASHFEHAFHPTQARTLTDARLGGMAALLTRFAVAVIHIHATEPDQSVNEGGSSGQSAEPASQAIVLEEASKKLQVDPPSVAGVNRDLPHFDSVSTPAHPSDNLDIQMMQDLDTMTFYTKLSIALGLFFVFWTVGSAIFMATEGWSYGMAMYFCFVAFTTIGYGDFYPATPAGRSIFVVWAILGVGTMTILISVIQEAYSSRYENAMHIRAFDKAVKHYRERIHHVKPVSKRKGRRFHLWGHHTHTQPDEPPQDKGRSTSPSSSVFTLPQTHPAAEEDKSRVSDSHERAQESLEALPGHVLRHAETFHAYIQLFVNDGHIIDTQKDGRTKAMTNGGVSHVTGTLRKLLDEIAILGGFGKATKEEILQDPDARHTLFVLSIEKALHKMITAAKEAVHAIKERDQLVTAAGGQQQQFAPDQLHPEGESSKLMENISAQEVGAP